MLCVFSGLNLVSYTVCTEIACITKKTSTGGKQSIVGEQIVYVAKLPAVESDGQLAKWRKAAYLWAYFRRREIYLREKNVTVAYAISSLNPIKQL